MQQLLLWLGLLEVLSGLPGIIQVRLPTTHPVPRRARPSLLLPAVRIVSSSCRRLAAGREGCGEE